MRARFCRLIVPLAALLLWGSLARVHQPSNQLSGSPVPIFGPLLSAEELVGDMSAANALLAAWPPNKPRGAFFMLARSQDLELVKGTVQEVEQRFNAKARYPWVFVSDHLFSQQFKREVGAASAAPTFFGLVPGQHWLIYPGTLNKTRAAQARAAMEVQSSDLFSDWQRRASRYFSGFFALHPLLEGFDYSWRVEPGASFPCSLQHDPFLTMQQRNLSLAFASLLRGGQSKQGKGQAKLDVPVAPASLWAETRTFLQAHPRLAAAEGGLQALLDENGQAWNRCLLWSSLEVARLSFFRGRAYQSYFAALDKAGGLMYERWDEAGVHTLAAAAFLPKQAVQQLEWLGYRLGQREHCPQGQQHRSACDCQPERDVAVIDPQGAGFCLAAWRGLQEDGGAGPLAWLAPSSAASA